MNPSNRVLISIVLVVAVAAPLLLSDFRVFQVTQILVYAIAILGLNLLTGYNGQISLGHGAFYAIGAYVTAILIDHYAMPYWATVPIAAIVCLVIGFLFGLPALRLEGPYLALATFVLALAVPQLLKHHSIETWTGGVQGIAITKPDAPFGLPLGQDQWLYYFTLAITAGLTLAASNIVRSRVGRALMALRDNPVAAETMGVDAALYKSAIFGISAMYTGIAGSLGAVIVQFVSPDSFTIFLSIFFLVGLVVGGVASVPGVFFGAAFILIVPSVSSDLSKAATGLIYGICLILMMYRLPGGIWGGLDRLRAKLGSR